MEKKISDCAIENFKNGYSCSESVVKAGVDCSLCDENLINVATSFSGGMSSGCLCGAIAGAQMVIGNLHGRGKTATARKKAAELVEEFSKQNKGTCCRMLTKGLDFNSAERKANCAKLVKSAGEILEKLV